MDLSKPAQAPENPGRHAVDYKAPAGRKPTSKKRVEDGNALPSRLCLDGSAS